jgi:site-specific recombinase XerC
LTTKSGIQVGNLKVERVKPINPASISPRTQFIKKQAKDRKPKREVSEHSTGACTKVNRGMVCRFRLWLTAQNYATGTVQTYSAVADEFCNYIGNKPLWEVVPIDISDFITSDLPAHWNDDLLNGRLACLRSFFDFLYLGGAVNSVPPRFLHPRKGTRKLPRTLTQSQVHRLLIKTRQPRDRALLELIYGTGCRLVEVRKLRVEDIDFRSRKIIVKGKRKERAVYFGSAASQTLFRKKNKWLSFPGGISAAKRSHSSNITDLGWALRSL